MEFCCFWSFLFLAFLGKAAIHIQLSMAPPSSKSRTIPQPSLMYTWLINSTHFQWFNTWWRHSHLFPKLTLLYRGLRLGILSHIWSFRPWLSNNRFQSVKTLMTWMTEIKTSGTSGCLRPQLAMMDAYT